jgi:UDP-N-acetylenolpyruvoylglucosamine reductase
LLFSRQNIFVGFGHQKLQKSAKWCRIYHELAPDDLLGLKKLAGVCTTLEEVRVEDESCREAAERERGKWKGEKGGSVFHSPTSNFQPAAVLREELEGRTDDRRIVAG